MYTNARLDFSGCNGIISCWRWRLISKASAIKLRLAKIRSRSDLNINVLLLGKPTCYYHYHGCSSAVYIVFLKFPQSSCYSGFTNRVPINMTAVRLLVLASFDQRLFLWARRSCFIGFVNLTSETTVLGTLPAFYSRFGCVPFTHLPKLFFSSSSGTLDQRHSAC